MRILFLINDIATEEINGTTALMAYHASKRGHEVFIADINNLIYFPDGHIGARSRRGGSRYRNSINFMKDLKQQDHAEELVSSEDLDILFLRSNPSEDIGERAWAQNAGVLFGKMAVLKGVIVINHPDTLAHAIVDKMYFEQFPQSVRPRTLISRNAEELYNFYKNEGEKVILKPLHGSGGKDVFMIEKDERNFQDIVATIGKSGFVIAQEYLPEASGGDVRLFMLNGQPMQYKGQYCAIKRATGKDDFRANLHAGAVAEKVKVDDQMLEVAYTLGPKFKKDGIFMVGLDVVGSKVLEINVMSPGGLLSASQVYEINFAEHIIDLLEQKVEYKRIYGDQLENVNLCTMQ